MINLINFSTAQNLPGRPVSTRLARYAILCRRVTVAHTLELSDADHGSSSGTNEFYS
jgi:hypothetical protein